MSDPLPIECGTCGEDLNKPGQWLACRDHYTARISEIKERFLGVEQERDDLKMSLGTVARELEGERDEWKQRHDELSDTIVQFGINNGNTASALLLFRLRAERAEALLERVNKGIKCDECKGTGSIEVYDQMVPSVQCSPCGGSGRGRDFYMILRDIDDYVATDAPTADDSEIMDAVREIEGGTCAIGDCFPDENGDEPGGVTLGLAHIGRGCNDLRRAFGTYEPSTPTKDNP